jgi:uncharacterized protein
MLEGGSFRADVSPDIIDGTPLIRAYGDTYFQIAHKRYETGICIHQGSIHEPWGCERVSQLSLTHFQDILENPPEVLIIGTGRSTCFPNENILSTLSEQHIGFECMDSRAAARTYNILIAEGRTVSCLLLLPNTRQ